MRESGILLPIFSLPSKYGIGCFSKEAYEFIDRMKEAGQSYWQILPLGPTGYGDSPYQSFSTFAGNPYFIDLQEFVKKEYLSKEDCKKMDFGSEREKIDYGKLYSARFKILKKAYKNSKIGKDKKFQKFIKKNAYWLDDYALFMGMKQSFGGKSWTQWTMDIKKRREAVLKKYKEELEQEVEFYQFLQFYFKKQWIKIKKYANSQGIKIIGDIPIYVAPDSSDIWANPELFQLDQNLTPTFVAGCPPDAFSKEGQLWGNPLYQWDYHKKTGYEWWMKRIAYSFQLYDVVRIDHFRGFDSYYSIPFGAKNAVNGKWEQGPGYEIFKTMKASLGEKAVIAEDLGFLTESVLKLVEGTGYPGMKVLQFAFDSREESDYLPHNYHKNCVVYTGTHDNDTTLGWYNSINSRDREFCREYLHFQQGNKEGINWELIRAAVASVADLAIIPMQDYLGLGTQARINTPSTLGDNWTWRMEKGAFTKELAEKIRKMNEIYKRIPKSHSTKGR